MKILASKQDAGTDVKSKELTTNVDGRFLYIPKTKGGGFIKGFTWEHNQLRVMLRNYHLHEEMVMDGNNQFVEGTDDIIFILNGIFPELNNSEKKLLSERSSVTICKQSLTSILEIPSNTSYRSIVMAVSRQYLQQLFGNISHPLVKDILSAKDNFAYETAVNAEMIKTASEMMHPSVPESIEIYYCKLKWQELLCNIFSLLVQRDAIRSKKLNINDIKSIYSLKFQLQNNLNEPPNIGLLSKKIGMSEPKMRKLFKQTFGQGVFDFFQYNRMQEAARLLRDERLTVSEVGYQLGFSNLSHFSRVFKQYIGMKPKKYSVSFD
ncbi:helix-turn-helix domain-containing protein [Chryseobacterium caseinilyticum]|uniref:Helix-turn-helix transcriptional regulator n=1 Tax=Chryseobacterium caseinilyticum TaxID=2771428 RepID=A0ABR8ZC56_9FLAO|nr:AraC family transcriptional regulator [Chryseobacterium caseinilyticum]MBD8082833.1 helix-turn-helix transcriptional regulator [Chryseobacterium caseinilyticum]